MDFKKYLDHKPIVQLSVLIGLMIFLNLLIDVFLVDALLSLKSRVVQTYDQPLILSRFSMSARYHFERLDNLMKNKSIGIGGGRATELNQKIHDQMEQTIEDLAVIEERALGPEFRAILQRIRVHLKVLNPVLEKSTMNGQKFDLRSWELNPHKNEIQKALSELTDQAAEQSYIFREKSIAFTQQRAWVAYAMMMLQVLFAIGFLIYFSQNILRPFRQHQEMSSDL